MCDDQDLDDEGLRQDLRSIAAEGGLVDGLDRVDKVGDRVKGGRGNGGSRNEDFECNLYFCRSDFFLRIL